MFPSACNVAIYKSLQLIGYDIFDGGILRPRGGR
jgi:hypothetical protein